MPKDEFCLSKTARIKPVTLLRTLTRVFSCEFSQYLQNGIFTKYLWTTVSGSSKSEYSEKSENGCFQNHFNLSRWDEYVVYMLFSAESCI